MTVHKSTIIAALDNSRASRHAFKQALSLAFSRRARLLVVAVTPRYEGTMSRLAFDDMEQSLSNPFAQILAEASSYASSLGYPVRTEHRVGLPSEEVVALAETERADLIVIGGCQRTQMQRVMLGRTTAHIIADAPCDVLIIPEGAEIRFGTILVGITDSSSSRKAGRAALLLAGDYGSTVHALAAVDVPVDRSLLYGVLQEAETQKRKGLQDFSSVAETFGIGPVCVLRRDSVENALIGYAQEKQADLIVIGSSESMSVGGVLSGSVLERVVSRASCPVLAVKSAGGIGTMPQETRMVG